MNFAYSTHISRWPADVFCLTGRQADGYGLATGLKPVTNAHLQVYLYEAFILFETGLLGRGISIADTEACFIVNMFPDTPSDSQLGMTVMALITITSS